MHSNELALWKSYHQQGCLASREKLILAYENVVKGAVRRMSKRFPAHADLGELYSTGMIGLIRAVDAYRLDKGCGFGTFAKIRVQGAILDALRKSDWAPRSLRSRARQIEKARTLLANDLGHDPSNEEICSAIGINEQELANHTQAFHQALSVPLDAIMLSSDNEGVTRAEKLADPLAENGLDNQMQASDTSSLKTAINRLTSQEQKVIGLHYFQDLNGREISAVLNISQARVSQLHAQAIDKLEKSGTLKRALHLA